MSRSNRKTRINYSTEKPTVEREKAKWTRQTARRGDYPPQIILLAW